MVFGFASLHAGRAIMSAAVLVLGLAVAPFTAHRAGATFSTCDTDPIVYLTNGMVVKTSVHIEDAAEDVSSIVYTLHAPQGTHVKSVVFPSSDPLSGKETLQFFADSSADTFETHALVCTGVAGIPVSMSTLVHGHGHGHESTTGTVMGLSGQDLTLSLSL